MGRLVLISLLGLVLCLSGCATYHPRTQVAVDEEWPSGPGTIPPSWYDYNPALKHWFDPWYSNPEIPR
jgi:hypothetical protein